MVRTRADGHGRTERDKGWPALDAAHAARQRSAPGVRRRHRRRSAGRTAGFERESGPPSFGLGSNNALRTRSTEKSNHLPHGYTRHARAATLSTPSLYTPHPLLQGRLSAFSITDSCNNREFTARPSIILAYSVCVVVRFMLYLSLYLEQDKH